MQVLTLGPFINYVTLEGVRHFVTEREGVWSMRIYAWAKIVSTVLVICGHRLHSVSVSCSCV